jgi:hypothetical protein
LPNRQAVVLRKCQLAGHKRAGLKTKCSVFNLQKLPLGSANMFAKKEERKKEKAKGER